MKNAQKPLGMNQGFTVGEVKLCFEVDEWLKWFIKHVYRCRETFYMFINQKIKMAIITLSFPMKIFTRNPNLKNNWHEMIVKRK